MIVLTTRRPEINSRVQTEGTYTTISLATFKEFLKWDADDTSEDTTMTACLKSAIKQAEAYTRRVIDRATWRTYLDGFNSFTFDVAPADTVSVKYYDVDNTLQTLSATDYTFKNKGADAYAELEFDLASSIELYDRYEPVYVEYSAGYTTYPSDLQDTILHQAADYFENRTNDLPGSMDQVSFGFHQRLFPYKML
ncbi:MAG TPA: hypothetical protein VGK59_02525 [Ohtaekwangia sp.]